MSGVNDCDHAFCFSGLQTSPVQVLGLSGMRIVEIVSMKEHNCVRNSAGQVWCFGENADGQVGYGRSMLLLYGHSTIQFVFRV